MKKRKKDRQQRTGFARGGILAMLFVCLFSAPFAAGCGVRREEDFVLEREEVQSADEEDGQSKNEEKFLYVHVCGAVNDPGLKLLLEGSRAFDALAQAGGFSEDADPSAVNLAAPLTDGQQLYFPALGEELKGVEADGRININTAGEKELCTLTGIGPSRAQAILEYRRIHGGFSCIEELMQVSGIKDAVYEKICDQITVQ